MSTLRQQYSSSSKNSFRKQKSIDLNDKQTNDNKKILRKQVSVEHVTLGLKHVPSSSAPINFNNVLWRNSTNSLTEPNLKIVSTSAVRKRAQFAASSISTSSLSNRQELLSDCLNGKMKSVGEGAKTRVNINIFLSQDVHDDAISDNETPGNSEQYALNNKASTNLSTNVAAKSVNNSEIPSTVPNGKLSVSARRAQFQASRRIMSAPIRPLNMEDQKNKRKPKTKKKIIRDKDDINDSPDEMPEDLATRKNISQPTLQKSSGKSKQLSSRSRSVLGCDQVGIETLVSMLSSGGSDSEKEDPTPPVQPQPVQKIEVPRARSGMLRKSVSFQDDDSFLQQQSTTQKKDLLNNRRNIPFTGRMRNTRSLFGQEISNLYLTTNDDDKNAMENKNENDINSSNKLREENEIAEKTRNKKIASNEMAEDKESQDDQTPKEQECWRLYEKMKKTGLNVSYDTILRGILKPSELRLLEKQKKFLVDIEEKSIDEDKTQHEPQKVN
ncbi:CLUMA_CG016288, isoform A [Clunio marinus]|uniref:CLUMA_CG016288, isoform A n=1 Tax=Clunio marinus TaxID=568069 RepID=A0A1J1IUH6_9DIPT|nr:CLUMA_CG016288, isoform A [Clunio marinus]